MQQPLMGVETEYGVAELSGRLDAMSSMQRAIRLLAAVRQRHAWLPDVHAESVFLGNGGRFYVDHGGLPEFATPECTDPYQVVASVRAGERILVEAARSVMRHEALPRDIVLLRTNIDYLQRHVTWGCHENYRYTTDTPTMAEQLVPHLTSRIIYTGAGGLNPLSPGVEFTLSPRVWHLDPRHPSSRMRAIVNLRNEPLASDGAQRLHLICGETVCSDTALLLKVGVTALIVAAIDAGARPGRSVPVVDAPRAMRRFAADPTCRALCRLSDGPRITAIEIQRRYLEAVEAMDAAGALPDWAGDVCRLWRETLDALDDDAARLAPVLDWPLKLSIMREWTEARIGWKRLGHWCRVLELLQSALDEAGPPPLELTPSFVLDPAGKLARQVAALTPFLLERGLDWNEIEDVFHLRLELFEADLRFGRLGGGGVFDRLDADGLLAHRRVGEDDIERAMSEPPGTSRARLRGRWVRRLHEAGRKVGIVCDWTSLADHERHRVLDLSDPFALKSRWRRTPANRATSQLGSSGPPTTRPP